MIRLHGFKRRKFEILCYLAIVFICTTTLFFWLATALKIPLPTLIHRINDTSIRMFVYFLILIPALVGFCLIRLLGKTKNSIESLSLSQMVFLVAIIIFSLLFGMQTTDTIKKFYSEIKEYSGKTLSEKNALNFGKVYKFAMYCKRQLPGRHRAELITDLDLDQDPGMIMQRSLSYFLYPIDLRGVDGTNPIYCYILFYKKDPMASLPKGFKALSPFDQFNLVAVKKELN